MIYEPKERKDIKEISGILFSYNVGAIGSSSRVAIELGITANTTTYQKYLPFNSMTITNDSSSDIIVYVNMDSEKATRVPSGTIKTITGYGIWSLVITNDSTAITTGQLTIDFEKTGMTSDEYTKRLAQAQNNNVFTNFFRRFL